MSTRVLPMAAVAACICLAASPSLALQSPGLPGPAPSAPSAPAPVAPDPQDPPAGPPPEPPQITQEIEELTRRLAVLAAALERLRSGEEPQDVTVDEARRWALGLAPSAAAAYRKRQGVSFAGYGEMLYENFAARDESGRDLSRPGKFDFLRLILYSGYRFTDRFLFNSEIEFEHTDEVSVEFAYLDFTASPSLTIRGGLLLLPMGLVNEFHEPTVFLGARRPETERRLLPSTWRENGAGVLGSRGSVSYRVYLVNGMDASRFSASGLRSGRQSGGEAKAADFAVVGRVDVTPTPGLFVGGSLYAGGSDQGMLAVDGLQLDVGTVIGELHAQAQIRGWDVRALYARAALDDVARLNQALGLQGVKSIGETLVGGYAQIGYDLLSQRRRDLSLTPYYRFERLNTQASVPAGFRTDPAQDVTLHTVGVEMKPIPQVVLKVDYQRVTNRARTGLSQFSIGLGYAF